MAVISEPSVSMALVASGCVLAASTPTMMAFCSR